MQHVRPLIDAVEMFAVAPASKSESLANTRTALLGSSSYRALESRMVFDGAGAATAAAAAVLDANSAATSDHAAIHVEVAGAVGAVLVFGTAIRVDQFVRDDTRL